MDIAIIGAGVTGLTAAYDLLKLGHHVTLYEARPYVGGVAAGFKDDSWDWSLERFYHHIFATDKDFLTLMREMSLAEEMLFPRPLTSLYHHGEVYPLDSALAVLQFTPLPFVDRVRFGAVAAFVRYNPFWQPFERVTADAWLSRTMGKRAYETLWQPLLEGKFGSHYREVNMAWFWARLAKRTPKLGYFKGGFQRLWDLLADEIRAHGGELHLETPVKAIHPIAQGLRLSLETQDVSHERVLATCSPQTLAELAPQLPQNYTAKLRNLTAMGAVVLVLSLKHQVSERHYWINIPKREGFPFLAFVEHTNYMAARHYGGDTIVYCGDYIDPEHPYFKMTAEAMFETFLPGIQRINPAFDRSWVKRMWKFSERYAQPVPPVNHSRAILPLQTLWESLWMANMSQVYPWDRGTNYAVALGRRAAKALAS